jgi:hypothetical protein
MLTAQGDPIHGELTGDTFSATPIPLYKAGQTTAYTPSATERVYITDLILGFGGSEGVSVYIGTALVFRASQNSNTHVSHRFETPVSGVAGAVPNITTDDGRSISIVIQGYITEK